MPASLLLSTPSRCSSSGSGLTFCRPRSSIGGETDDKCRHGAPSDEWTILYVDINSGLRYFTLWSFLNALVLQSLKIASGGQKIILCPNGYHRFYIQIDSINQSGFNTCFAVNLKHNHGNRNREALLQSINQGLTSVSLSTDGIGIVKLTWFGRDSSCYAKVNFY